MELKRHKDFINESNETNPTVEIADRIEMIKMADEHHPVEPGDQGTVVHIDGIGQIHVDWDSGRTLAIIPEEDRFKVLEK